MRTVIRFLLLLLLAGCYPRCQPLEPQICISVSESDLRSLGNAFAPLSQDERETAWGIELRIGEAFGRELDFYRAITAFERSLILLPSGNRRALQLQYDIVLCYYLAGRKCDAIEAFEQSELIFVDHTFAALKDLLLILYDCYQSECQFERAAAILHQLERVAPEEAQAVSLATSIERVDWPLLEASAAPQLDLLIERYCCCKKSERRAEILAALLPGAGYWYVGQRQAAVTSALLNGLFIWASYAFFRNGYIAAGVITTSFELGWYFGGIYGSAAAAHYYNETIWSCEATPYLRHYRLPPLLRLSYAF